MSDNDDLKARKVRDNGDGTETWLAPVTVRSDVMKGREIVWVRMLEEGDIFIAEHGSELIPHGATCSRMRVIVRLVQKPSWKPPASLKPGRYRWDGGGYLSGNGASIGRSWASMTMRDWTDPPAVGWLVVNQDGTATFEGE